MAADSLKANGCVCNFSGDTNEAKGSSIRLCVNSFASFACLLPETREYLTADSATIKNKSLLGINDTPDVSITAS